MLFAMALAGPAGAQEEAALERPTDLHREPEGAPLVSLPAGAPVDTGRSEGDWKQATVEGWVFTSSTARTRRDGYDLVVTPDDGENLRSSPNGEVVGRAREGTLLKRVGQRGKWTRVRREGWVPSEAVTADRSPAPRATSQGTARTVRAAPAPPPTPEMVETLRETGLSAAPTGSSYGTLQSGIPARVLGRSGGWVRVQVDGWVRESDLKPVEGGVLVGVTAAEVRAAPDRFVGQTLDWRLQLIAVQSADELRGEMAPGQPYLLTRGPLPEPGFVYVAVPQGQVAEFRALPPLHELVLRLNLKAARTKFLSTPVAELVSVVSGMERK
ncbi:MAG: SH3 domain-containing protein [Gemmatimonadales bacterium]